ncbi:hypothetical protein [Streptomyces sp. NPDC005423]|uniref:hypothetical protein n=1 Tax=Streptomyces sp. NPDC005423 TaxID=3155343 RepID=UPI0033ACF1C6
MTTYIITVPGTFLSEPTDAARSTIEARLRPGDPQRTPLGRAEDLDILSVNDDGTFGVRLEVEADDSHSAEDRAKRAVTAAFAAAGVSESDAPLGPAVVTGIDTQA